MNQQIARKLRKQGHEFVWCEVASDEFGSSDKTGESVLDKPFFTWFWEVVLGNSSEEYRREFYREQHLGHTIGPSPISFGSPDFKSSSLPYARVVENDLFFRLVFLMVPGTLVWLVRRVFSVALRKTRRPSYYEKERERRIALGITRRSIRMRKTVNREPTVDEIRAAWNGARHSPEGALRLGGMLEDLECYVNNLTIGNEVEGYRGRRGGIKRHLQTKAPDLFEHYAALMRYKSIARKFRQACEVSDPNPTDALLPMSAPPRPQKQRTNRSEQIKQSQNRASTSVGNSVGKTADLANDVATVTMVATVATGDAEKRSEQIKQSEIACEEGDWRGNVVQKGVKAWVLDDFMFAWREDCWIRRESYETAIRVLRASENSVISLEAALALEIDPNFVTGEAVRRYGVKAETTTRRLKKTGIQNTGGRTGPNKSSDSRGGELKVGGRTDEQTGPNKSSDSRNGELKVDGKTDERTGPNKSSDPSSRNSEGGDSARRGKAKGRKTSARIVGWLKRRNGVA